MNPLVSRKKLLIAESELNRAHLVHEYQELATEASALAGRFVNFTSLASAAMSLVAVLVSSKPATDASGKTSWWQKLLQGARPLAALWTVFRDRSE